mmetsp:Transcript_19791/g.54425  ORF Transcript_19791/g.54425 Transcript_19791/m.54425 type:complete len:176 (-) Transcript_19791:126-653(-)
MGGKGATKGATRGGNGSYKSASVREVQKPWVKQETGYPRGGKSAGKGRKGKGKGKKLRAAPLNSKFWERKVEGENREELGGEYSGTVQRYLWKFGWGFIAPDDPEEIPRQAKDKLAEAQAAAEENGKEWTDANLLYFRKPDVNHTDGFKLTADVPVTFSVYVDDKGAGAYNVSMA